MTVKTQTISIMYSRVIIYNMQDLFFRAKIEQICRNFRTTVSHADTLRELKSMHDSRSKSLVVFDIASSLSELRELLEICSIIGAETLGHYSHIDTETREAAVNAGMKNIATRSELQKKLSALIQK